MRKKERERKSDGERERRKERGRKRWGEREEEKERGREGKRTQRHRESFSKILLQTKQ